MIGAFVWAIGDGWIPPASTGPAPEMTSHDTAYMLNPNDKPADLAITVYFRDREPADPYRATIRPAGCSTSGSTTSTTPNPSRMAWTTRY
jgi:hypothetical protein